MLAFLKNLEDCLWLCLTRTKGVKNAKNANNVFMKDIFIRLIFGIILLI